MDKNTIIGFTLIAAVLIGFSWWNQPSEEEIKAQQEQIEREAAAQQKKDADAARIAARGQEELAQALRDTTALFHKALQGTPQPVVLKNDFLELTLNTKGATVERVYIKSYTDNMKGTQGVVLFNGSEQSLNYILTAKERNISTKDLYFQPSEQTDSTVVLTAEAGAGKYLRISYRLGKDYMLHASLQAVGMEGLFASLTNTLDIDWQERCKQQEKGFSFENR